MGTSSSGNHVWVHEGDFEGLCLSLSEANKGGGEHPSVLSKSCGGSWFFAASHFPKHKGGGVPVSPAAFQKLRAEGKINMVKSENAVLISRLSLKIARMFFVSIVNYGNKEIMGNNLCPSC